MVCGGVVACGCAEGGCVGGRGVVVRHRRGMLVVVDDTDQDTPLLSAYIVLFLMEIVVLRPTSME